MKKFLILTLSTASLAYAGDKDLAPSKAFDVKLGGFVEFNALYSDDKVLNGQKDSTKSDAISRVLLEGAGQSQGLKYGFILNLDPLQSTNAIDDIGAHVKTSAGTTLFGYGQGFHAQNPYSSQSAVGFNINNDDAKYIAGSTTIGNNRTGRLASHDGSTDVKIGQKFEVSGFNFAAFYEPQGDSYTGSVDRGLKFDGGSAKIGFATSRKDKEESYAGGAAIAYGDVKLNLSAGVNNDDFTYNSQSYTKNAFYGAGLAYGLDRYTFSLEANIANFAGATGVSDISYKELSGGLAYKLAPGLNLIGRAYVADDESNSNFATIGAVQFVF